VAVPYPGIDDPVMLRRLMSAMLLIERDLSLPVLLEHLVEEARSMAGARYGALGVLNDDHTELSQFVTSGISPDEAARIGPLPTGRGVLGLLITHPEPVRLADIHSHPDSYGFPPGHPPMTSFLGVPVKVRGEVYGNLYLTEKEGWAEFTYYDEKLMEALALAAGIAIENARLHERVQELAVLDDRDRIARDLHDDVIQRLFAVGLSLQGMVRSTAEVGLDPRLGQAVAEIDESIRQIRSTIFELGQGQRATGVRRRVLDLVRQVAVAVGLDVRVEFEGPVDSMVPDDVAENLLAVVREAVSNVGRHARATSAGVTVAAGGGWCRVVVVDDGVGMGSADPSSAGGGLGLANLRRRAEKLHGDLVVERPDGGGTRLTWRVPVPG
jgi:signal transduction histidine kinase